MAGGGAAPASPATSHRRRPRAQTRGGWLQTLGVMQTRVATCPDTRATCHVSPAWLWSPHVPGAACAGTAGGARPRCPLSAVRCPGPALSSPPRPDWRPAATSSHQQPPAPDIDGTSTRVRGVFSSRSFSDTLLDVTGGQVPRRRVTAAARRPPHSRPRPGRCSLGWARTGSAEVLSRTDRAAQLGPPPTPELTVS